jgi:hypothetical protein
MISRYYHDVFQRYEDIITMYFFVFESLRISYWFIMLLDDLLLGISLLICWYLVAFLLFLCVSQVT